ncbi:NACHT, LRR and PYD domains-containing protein 3 [Silurus asotus]|uniref:NACHT, LRR and PYD domains-containing protein 3 n=1 Tax=Silurus asotus TaxID=30991 RepID=A0AAD5FVN7_SILAS|nr:NACHT, LRR and PYD domains-containing protein 3 [Silurus asotus]
MVSDESVMVSDVSVMVSDVNGKVREESEKSSKKSEGDQVVSEGAEGSQACEMEEALTEQLSDLSQRSLESIRDEEQWLWNCGISDEGCAALASALRSNPSHLRDLYLYGNKVGDSGVKCLSDLKDDKRYKLQTLE